jgi:hypothetical protein
MIIAKDSNNAQGDDAASQENQDHFFSDRHVNSHPKSIRLLSVQQQVKKNPAPFLPGFWLTIPNIFEILLKKIRNFSNLMMYFVRL